MYRRQYKYQFAGSSSSLLLSSIPLTPFSTFSDGPSQQFVQTKNQ